MRDEPVTSIERETPAPMDGPSIIEAHYAELLAELLGLLAYHHLPTHLAAVSKPFHDLGHQLVNELPVGYQLIVGLQQMLEAKDCMVRMAVVKASLEARVEIPQGD